jgi:hypothetical protein
MDSIMYVIITISITKVYRMLFQHRTKCSKHGRDLYLINKKAGSTQQCFNLNPSLHEFPKTWQKKFHLIKYIQKHNKYYTKITLLMIFWILIKICICITAIVNFYIIWICITYDTCLLTTSQWHPLEYIISVTPQQ